MTLGVRAAVLDGEKRVLLVQHGYVQGWHLPGGGVEPGETLLDAVARELLEEGNVVLRGTPKLHGVFLNSSASSRDHVALFVVRDFEWKGELPPRYEIRAAKFLPLTNLPQETSQATKRRLEEIQTGAAPPPIW
jgi:ADP-ribose pyrophosphatase YjhB (NUDIX family)